MKYKGGKNKMAYKIEWKIGKNKKGISTRTFGKKSDALKELKKDKHLLPSKAKVVKLKNL